MVVESPAAAAATGLVLSAVSDCAALEAISDGPDGLIGALPVGGIHVGLSTVRPETIASLVERHCALGGTFVAAPVVGRPNVIRAGSGVCLVGGADWATLRVRPVLVHAVGRVLPVGHHPAEAASLKLAANLLAGGLLFALAESLAIVSAAGPDGPRQLQALIDVVLPVPMARAYLDSLITGPPEAGFPSRLAKKDLALIVERLRTSRPRLSHALLGMFENQHLPSDEDWSVVARAATFGA